MAILEGIVITILSTAVIGLAGWVYRMGIKVTELEAQKQLLIRLFDERNEALAKLIEAKFDNVSDKFDAVNQRLGRVEKSLNGFLVGH